ncbi:putative F420-0 ABC transporter substrate-binding protein [Agromyces sp. MMS17-SY077]|uniref:Putative F420-0 ABC transporter substrate-binding protein n=1 Tax=Agromyces seonyuensis TaxID=2662446 RepID=A0A6I4P1K2_9MICO|nr:putative F420-0 ABC transporter substrate-binding protein [Agromyces seonyuensis]
MRRLAAAAAAAGGILLLAACSSAAPAPEATEDAAAASGAYPLTIDNCGTEVTVDAAPERVLTVKSTTLETMLALGLGDLVVGSAFSDGPVPEEWTDEAADIAVVSDKVPGQEAVLGLEPDFVYAGWESNLTADGAGDRAVLADLGVGTYVSPSACKEPGYQPDPLTFGDVFGEIVEAGTIFGVPERASGLVSEQQAELAAIEPSTSGLSALWYSSGTDTPYVGAGIGAPQMMLQQAGLTNVMADVHDTWTSAGWESIVAADPDVIVLVDATWNTADSKIANLEANPATAAMTAVREHRYLTVPFAASEAGVRNVETVGSLVDQLGDLGL